MAQGNSNNRNAARIAGEQTAGQHTTSNDADSALDAGSTERTAFQIDDSNARTLNQSEVQGSHTFRFTNDTPAPTAAVTITMNATTARGTFWVINDLDEELTIEISGQAEPSPVLQPGTMKHLNHDAIDVFEVQGFETFRVRKADMVARTTAGAASGLVEATTNLQMLDTFDFDTAADEFVQWSGRMPKRWDGGDIYITPVWSHASTATNFGVAWFFQAVAYADGDALDVAFGTAVGSVDTGGTTDDLYIGPETTAITIAGTPAPNAAEYVIIQCYRDISDAGDDLGIDARLHEFTVRYGVTSTLDD